MSLEVSPKQVLLFLLVMIGLLLCANLTMMVSKFLFGHDWVYGFAPMLDFGAQGNLPAIFSSFQLMLASLLLAIICRARRSRSEDYLYWLLLSGIFLFLAADEYWQLHNRLNAPLRHLLNIRSLFPFGWIVPYGIGVLVCLGIFSRFLIRLPRHTMWLFIASGAIYLSGALGLELIGRFYARSVARSDLVLALLSTTEECLEMLGVAFFVYALLAYASAESQYLRVTDTG